MKKIFSPRNRGYLFANAFSITAIGFSAWIINTWNHEGPNGTFIFSEFIIIPFVMGMISSWFWQKENISSRQLINRSILNGIITIVLSAMFLGEGIVCLIIVSPLLIICISAGAFAGRSMFKEDNSTLNSSIFAALFLVFITDSISEHHYQNMVSDQLVINATPDKIWKNVVAFEHIKEENKYWLFKVGMPSPVQSTVTGYHVGAGRKCIFSNGYVFDEKIVTYDENENLTFDVTHQPRDPEIMGHIDILRGQFILKDNGDGTTTLTGNSWYKLYVFPTWYYDIWAKSITRNVHWRVMEHIKELSEAK